MSHFLGNDSVTFDTEKITIVRWRFCKVANTAKIEFNDGKTLTLNYKDDDDFQLINDLRDCFGYEQLPINC